MSSPSPAPERRSSPSPLPPSPPPSAHPADPVVTPPGAERVLVCVGPSPGSERLIRAAQALAARLGGTWIAVHVALPEPLSDAERARVEDHLRLAESLGGEVARLAGHTVASTLLSFGAEQGVTRILVGRARTPRWREVLFGSVLDELLRSAPDVEVHVTVGDDAPSTPDMPAKRRRLRLGDAALVFGAVAVVSVGGLAIPLLSRADVLMGYLLAVLGVAFFRGRGAGIAASVLSITAFQLFFVPASSGAGERVAAVEPASRNLLSFGMLFAAGLAASALAERLRRHEAEAIARERRTATLLALTRAVAGAADEPALARLIVREASSRIARGAALLVPGSAGALTCLAEAGEPGAPDEAAWAGEALSRRVPLTDRRRHAAPVLASAAPAVLVLRDPDPGTSDLADAYTRQTALALARVRHAAAAEAATLRARTEELRSALLSTVSHDLRTPLAAITGAATTLLDGGVALSSADRAALLRSVRDEAARLERLVTNLLEMTRLASAEVALHREWVPLDEVLGAAFARVERALVGHRVTVDLAPDLPLLEIDPVLFEHLLVNLLENAARHTPAGTAITVSARVRPEARPVGPAGAGPTPGSASLGGVEIVVADAGAGFSPGDLERLFEPFVRGAPSRTPGSGLGLAICRGVVRAHGGEIWAERRDPGAAVVVVLPGRPAPAPPPEPEEAA